jgi:hypothetical protein
MTIFAPRVSKKPDITRAQPALVSSLAVNAKAREVRLKFA